MQHDRPYKRQRRTRRDMIVLGGWLFADLLLGLAMLFFAANTVGSPPPTPTPTATPNELATAEVAFNQQSAAQQQTVEALQVNITGAEQTAAARATAQAEAALAATEEAAAAQTRQALSEEERPSRRRSGPRLTPRRLRTPLPPKRPSPPSPPYKLNPGRRPTT
jgi:hypothetical protein